MNFLILTDVYSNNIVINTNEIVTIENDRNQTVITLKEGKSLLIKETVAEVWDLFNLKK